jgi:group I intron endonuclease
MEELTNNSKSGIYGIYYKDKIIYIGQSVNMYSRMKQHIRSLKNNKHHNFIIQRIYNKSSEKIKFVVIENIDENLTEREQHWIDLHDTFNISKANGSHVHTSESRLKMSKYARNRTEIHLERLSLAKKGIPSKFKDVKGFFKHTDESKLKISKASKGNKYCLGIKHTDETKKKLSDIRRGVVNIKMVLDTSTGIFYESLKMACFSLCLNYSTTSNRLVGRTKNNTNLIYV